MQTFLPYKSFTKTAQCLDDKRLCKQRVEAYQILLAITNPKYGWQYHPAVKMWIGHELALVQYINAICDEWTKRGFNDTVKDKTFLYAMQFAHFSREFGYNQYYPKFLNNQRFLNSHRSNLLRKNKEHYSKFKWKVKDNLEYVWPSKEVSK